MRKLLYTLLGVAGFGLGTAAVAERDPSIGPHCNYFVPGTWNAQVVKDKGKSGVTHFNSPDIDHVKIWFDGATPLSTINGTCEFWIENQNNDYKYVASRDYAGIVTRDVEFYQVAVCGPNAGNHRTHDFSGYNGILGVYEQGEDPDEWECHIDWDTNHSGAF